MVNWSDPKSKISQYFTVHEALYLPAWECYHTPSEEEKVAILSHAPKMDKVREYLGQPIHTHCWIRPKVVNCPTSRWHGRNYNAFRNGAPGSAHIDGIATDFHVSQMLCSEVRMVLVPVLAEFGIRMENTDSEAWVHVDSRNPLPKKSRYFRP